MSGRDSFRKYKLFINIGAFIFSFLPDNFLVKMNNLFRNIDGKFGLILRYFIVKSLAEDCGENVSIHPNCFLFGIKNLKLGSNISIHPMSYIDANGGVEIGDNVSIAHGVTILSSSHTYDEALVPIKYQRLKFCRTIIHENNWIGCKSTILCGVLIESDSIIGANSVVNKNVNKNSIVAGVPAKFIKKVR
jgi:acetyltransferase-like isoleucine patch superfamily enzyme